MQNAVHLSTWSTQISLQKHYVRSYRPLQVYILTVCYRQESRNAFISPTWLSSSPMYKVFYIATKFRVQVATHNLLQGGGPHSDCDDEFCRQRFTVCTCILPMEVVTVAQRVEVVELNSLIEIPSEVQVRQAISNLYKQKSDCPDKFSYIKFPFGMIGYNELDMLLKYHEHMTYTKKANEENVWLEHAKQNCRNLGIDIDKICKYVCSTRKSCHNASIWTLVGERWLTDEAIDSVFGIINKKHDKQYVLCVSPLGFCTLLPD